MFFARFFALFFLFTSFGIVSSAAAVKKRQDTADVETVLNMLKNSTDTILPQITSVGQSGIASDATVTPLINELITALNTATSSLASLQTSSRKARRQSDDDIANLVAGIITDIADTLDTLLGDLSAIPDLGSLFDGVDSALDEVLTGLETLLAGVLTLVADLCVALFLFEVCFALTILSDPRRLVDVAGLLESLSLGLTLASLGL
ncbi:hypothetical protein C8J55DRAFT_479989 [Lentinula edodes]|uniref:Sc15 protein n=1 Tax=Lentinula lateritia TaxID=40482 RepID=A0A9W9DGX4_9AGAR|nr:hypothetical protein C8J55DRAFT_479989 [Lentinula edodes]